MIATGFAAGGVVGVTRGSGPGLWGQANVGTGPAVKAEIDTATANAATIEAAQSGSGYGVFPTSTDTRDPARSWPWHSSTALPRRGSERRQVEQTPVDPEPVEIVEVTVDPGRGLDRRDESRR